MTRSDLLTFFAERPLLSGNGIGKASGVTGRMVNLIIKGDRELSEKIAERLLPTMLLYGWQNEKYLPYAEKERKKLNAIIYKAKPKKGPKVRYVLK